MDNASFETGTDVYVNSVDYANYSVAPDIIIQQPITSQPSSEPGCEEPIRGQKDRNSASEDRKSAVVDKVYALDGEQSKRDWGSDLYYSLTGKPHKRTFWDNVKVATRDCFCVSCLMVSIARRLGDPPYLAYVPCTGPALRFKVRILGGIAGTIADDCLVTSCCWPCAVCQMYRELEDIGL